MTHTPTLRWAGAGMIVAALLVALVLFERTSAQSPTQTATPATATPRATSQPAPRATPQPGERQHGRHGPRGHGDGIHVDIVRAAADVTGLTTEQVRAELAAGKTLAQIAQKHGKTADDMVNALVAQAKTHLDAEVAAGRMTQEQANTRLELARTRAAELVNKTGLPGGRKGGWHRDGMHGGRGLLVEATAEVTGLTTEQVRAELAAGKTLAQIAQEHGKTADDIIANLRVKGEQQLETLLDRARDQLDQPMQR